MKKKQMIVVAAIIREGGRYLITQRPVDGHLPLKWEFPGGEVKPGETPKFSLRREIAEELNIAVIINEFFGKSSYIYDKTGHVILLGYLCEFAPGDIKKGVNYVWVTPGEMNDYDFCEADIPLVRKLQGKE